MKSIFILENALDLRVIERFKPSETAEALATAMQFVWGERCIERVPIVVIEPNTISKGRISRTGVSI